MELSSRGHQPCQLQQEGWSWNFVLPPNYFTSSLLFYPTSARLPMMVPLPRQHQQLQGQLRPFNVSLPDHCLLSLQLSFSTLPAPTILGPYQDLQTIVLGTFLLSLTLALPPALFTQLRLVGHHCITPLYAFSCLSPLSFHCTKLAKPYTYFKPALPLTTCLQLSS